MPPHAAPFLALICLIFAAAGDITNTVNTGRRAGSMSGLVLDVYGGDSSSKGRRLEFQHCIQLTFFTLICCKNWFDFCLKRPIINKKRLLYYLIFVWTVSGQVVSALTFISDDPTSNCSLVQLVWTSLEEPWCDPARSTPANPLSNFIFVNCQKWSKN